ncbi:MAG TPA: hypothetical protein DEH25_13235 [Chloroflexi bacterium]|nr:hypothetical protein [Chloroflexota bacterium]
MNQFSILIVEDEILVAKDIENKLIQAGYRVIGRAASGQEAIALAESEKPDLALMDIQLNGEMNGIETATYLSEKLDIPIIYLTAFADAQTLQRAKQTTPYSYLIKPFDPQKLLISIEIAIHKHQLDRRLAQSELRYRSLFQSSSVSIIVLDLNEKIIDCNDKTLEITGRTRTQLMGKSFFEIGLIASDDIERIRSIYQHILLGEQIPEQTLKIYRPDHSYRWVEAAVSPLHNPKDGLFAFQVVARDVTDRMQIEETLRLSEEQFSKAFQSGPLLMTISTIEDGTYIEVNKNFIQVTGYSRAEAIGNTSIDLGVISKEDRNKLKAHLVSTGKISGEEVLFQKKSGEMFPTLYFGEIITIAGKQRLLSIAENITERKRAGKALQETQERLQAITANTPDHIIINDKNLRYTYVINPQLGLTQEDMIGKTDFDFLLEEEAQRLTTAKKQVMETGEPQYYETSLVSRAGEDEFFEGTFVPKFDTRGQTDGLIGYFRNVTQRKQVENALRESEERFHLMFENHSAVMLLIEPVSGQIVDANTAAQNYYGYPLETLKLMQIQDLNVLPPEEVAERRKQASSQNQNFFIFPHRLSSGEIRTVEVHSSPIRIQGELMLFSIIHDITERLKAEEALLESQSILSTAEEVAKVGSWKWDLRTRKVTWSDGMFRLFGVERQGFDGDVNRIVAERIHPDDALAVQASNRSVLQDAQPIPLSYRIVLPDGTERTVWAQGQLMRDENGQPLALTGYVQDITERIQAEEALQASEARYRTTFENAPIAIWEEDFSAVQARFEELRTVGVSDFDEYLTANPDELINLSALGRITAINQTSVTVLGADSKEQVVRDLPQYFTDESLPAFQREMVALAQSATHFEAEIPVVNSIGKPITLALTLTVLPGFEQDLSRVLVSFIDITGRLQAQRALVKSEERYRLLFEQMISGFALHEIICDENGNPLDYRFLEINPAFEALTGLKAAEILGKTVLEIMPNTEPYWIENYGRVALQNEIFEMENFSQELGRYYQVKAFSPQPGQFAVLFDDVTMQRQAEKNRQYQASVNKALADMGRVLIDPQLPIETITEITLDYALILTGSQHGFVSVIDSTTGDNIAYTLTNMMESECKLNGADRRTVFTIGADGLYPSLWGSVLNTGQATYTNTPKAHPASTGLPQGHVPLQNFLSAPAKIGERLIGQIALANVKTGYTDDDLTTIQRLSDLYAISLQRKRADDALRENEERFRLFFENAPDSYQALDAENRFLEVNQAWLDTFGYSREEVIGRWFGDFATPKSAEFLRNQFPNLITLGRDQNFDLELICKDGTPLIVVLTWKVARDSDGNFMQTHCVLHNITERVKAEEALQASEEKHRRLFENAYDSIFIIDPNTEKFIDANQIAAHRLGYMRAELLQMGFEDLDAPTPATQYKKIWQQLRENGSVLFEQVHVRKDGSLMPVEVSIHQVQYGNRTVLQSVVRDITERKQAELEMKRHNEELRALNTIASSSGSTRDQKQLLNTTLQKTIDVTQMDGGWILLVRENRTEFMLGASMGISNQTRLDLMQFSVQSGMAGRCYQQGEIICIFDVENEPVLNDDVTKREQRKVVIYFPIVAGDEILGVISVFKRSQQSLQPEDFPILTAIGHQLGLGLQNLALADQTAELNILREMDRLRSEFIANVSHEVRTPLGLIKIFAATLLRKDVKLDAETQREFISNIDDESDKLTEIVNNLLDLSRIEAGKMQLHKQSADLMQMADEVITGLRANSSMHNFVINSPSTPLVTDVDRVRIEQVLRNLLGNAIKYSPNGGQIIIGGKMEDEQIMIWVRDNGIGIPPENLDRIFERFYRIQTEETYGVRGAGLGLSVSKAIIEAHGGRIWAESGSGGSTIYFSLPTV